MPTGNTQQVINYGASANDGQGDPLRTAFIKTDDNFDNIWLAGPVGSNVRITNNTIGVLDTNGNLILSPNGIGVVQTNNHLVPRATRTYDLGSSGLQYRTVYANSAVFQTLSAAGDFSVGGNLTVAGDIIEMGNIVTDALTIQLANTAANTGSANGAGVTVGAADNIATLLYNASSNVWTTNIGLSAAGNITAPYLFGNGSQLTGVSNYANANAVAYGEAGWTGNIIPNGNAVYSLGNATNQWSDLYVSNATIYMNGIAIGLTAGNVLTVNGEDVLSNNSNASISTAGNITADYFLGNVSQATGLPVIPANISAFNNDSGYITANVTGNIGATGNVSGSYILGNGSQLTGLPVSYTNANVVSLLSAFGSNTISTTGNVTTGRFTGSTAVIAGLNTRGEHAANLGVSGFTELNANVVVQTTGNANGYAQFNFQNINDGNRATTDFIATAAFGTDSTYFVDMGIAGGQYDSNNPDNSLGNSLYPQDSYLYAQGGNSLGGSGGNLVVGSNEPGGVVRIIANGSTTDNIVATFSNVGIAVSGDVNAIGNVSGNYILGNGSQLTGLPASYTNANVVSLLSAFGSNTISTTGNISGGYILGNGSQLTGLPATYSNSNVASFMSAFGSNTISTTGNITAGNIIGNISITGNVTGTSSNVDLVAGSYTWSFNNTGNLVLPGNTFAVNYANGTAVALGGNYGNSNVTSLLASLGSNAISTTGNITAGNFIGNISITGNVVGTSPNVSLSAGSFTATFDNTGILTLPTCGGDEGGEINFGIPASNTTLITRVVTDVYQDKFRIFDGSTKGVYVDLSQAGSGVSTLLNNRVSGFVNAGTFVTMDLIKATVTTTGNRGLSLATTTGTFTYNIGGTFGMSGAGSGGQSFAGQTLTTTATTSIFGWGFLASGDLSTYVLTDTTNNRCYRITLQVGASFNNNAITIERLI